jgi:hypothetical protein
VQRNVALCSAAALVWIASCSRAPKTDALPPIESERPLAAYAAQRILVTPTGRVRAADSLGWVARLGGARVVALRLDTSIVAELSARGVAPRWVWPADLARAHERNRTYVPDPYQLVWEPVRSPKFITGARYGEPLSSQLRTMIALHDDARYVLLPIELRFDRAGGSSAGRAVLRTALVDARTTEARMVADVRGDTSSNPTIALAKVAAKLADLFVAP